MNSKRCDIVIISYNTCELTMKCVKSVIDTGADYINKIIVVDNASNDNSVQSIKKEFPDVIIIANESNLGYARASNIGANMSKSDFLIISNSDVIFHLNSLKILIDYLNINSKVGISGPMQLFPNNIYQRSYGELPGIKLGLEDLFFIYHIKNYINKKRRSRTKELDVNYLDGAVLAFRKSAFIEVKGFDEDFFFYTEEADICFRIKKSGWRVVHIPQSVVTHFRGATDQQNIINEKRYKMLIGSKALFCRKNLSFNEAKIFMIFEIIYSLNMSIIWRLAGIFSSNKEKAKTKSKIFKLFFNNWIFEFNNFLAGH